MRNFNIAKPDLSDKSILITGGTGSFGQAFVDRVLTSCRPAKLIIFSRDEHKQAEMAARLSPKDLSTVRFFIGDVRDEKRLEMAMREVDIVIHAAAMKHVPLAEYNPFECIHTNVLGAENIVRAALYNSVKQVLALSTDKAVNPVNLYGASKLASDKIFVAANNLSGSIGARFAIVRYGNVVGSRGSVVPYFKRLLREGTDSLPITDPRMTRFWITLDQGIDFVLSCLATMRGWEIFIPKIPSMRITDLAAAMAPNVPQRTIGIRPGEKLHEVLITEDDTRGTIELDDRYIILPPKGDGGLGLNGEQEQVSNPYDAIGKAVPDGFRYASDSNGEWLLPEVLQRMIAETS